MDIFLKKYLIKHKDILLVSKDDYLIKLSNELNTDITYISEIQDLNLPEKTYDIVLCDLMDINVDIIKLIKITDKYLILLNTENTDDIKLFMELNDDWIYDNDEWTHENKIIVIKKKSEQEKNVICIIKENAIFYNPKSFELFDYYFNNSYKIVYKNADNINMFVEQKNKKNNVIIFIRSTFEDSFDAIALKYLQKHENIISENFIIVQDWWYASSFNKCRSTKGQIRKDILKANTYKIIVIADNVEMLADFNNEDCLEFKNNIICYNYWGIYKSAIMEFNNNPTKKILVSGCLAKNCYPERRKLLNLSNENIYVYEYNNNDVSINDKLNNNYSKELNKYLCCFSSSVHVVNLKLGKIKNTHIVLLKTFEILASGSLLLVPDYEEPYLKKIGLIKEKHYLTLNFNENDDSINNQINNLFNENNLSNINEIRLNGYNYAINNLTNKQRFNELNEIFIKS
jgi:hypothetical protein